jgi:hypothetical protein
MSDVVIVACIATIPPTLAAVAALIAVIRKIDKLTIQVDGRLTQLLASVGAENQATGHAAGVEAERVREKDHHS